MGWTVWLTGVFGSAANALNRHFGAGSLRECDRALQIGGMMTRSLILVPAPLRHAPCGRDSVPFQRHGGPVDVRSHRLSLIPDGYPTRDQEARGFTGNAIGIHGLVRWSRRAGSGNTAVDWTLGCVAVGSDAEIDAIAALGV